MNLLLLFSLVLLYVYLVQGIKSSFNNTSIFNVKDYGAVGDGITDDTNSVISAAKMTLYSGGVLYFPSGNFVITSTINLVSSIPYEVAGDGTSSSILWSFDGHLFEINPTPNNQVGDITIKDLRIHSTKVHKTTTNAAIYCVTCVRSLFINLLIDGDDNNPGSGIVMTDVADTNTVRDCQFWNIKGTGIEIARGSEVRILGGRIIGDASRNDSSIGVHVTGNNGGVHIDSTDIIALQTAVLLDDSNGAGSNREIFLTHATLDSCWRGLSIRDNSYVSISGCWASSCDQDNIWVDVGISPTLVISGGTIFNAGTYTCPSPTTGCNGITVNSGTFIINGVEIRNNLGKGVWIPNGSVNEYVISGCRIFANGVGLELGGSSYIVSSNVCSGNANNNSFGGSSNLVTNNIGC